jgi:hypothetical protein
MKTDFRIIIASLKIVGLVLLLVSWDGSTSFALGPGGGCIEVLNVVFGAILVGDENMKVKESSMAMTVTVKIWKVEGAKGHGGRPMQIYRYRRDQPQNIECYPSLGLDIIEDD